MVVDIVIVYFSRCWRLRNYGLGCSLKVKNFSMNNENICIFV